MSDGNEGYTNIVDRVKGEIQGWINKLSSEHQTHSIRIDKVDKELDTVRSQNAQIRVDIAQLKIPEVIYPITTEEVRALIKEDGKETRKILLIALFTTTGCLAILLIILNFIFG